MIQTKKLKPVEHAREEVSANDALTCANTALGRANDALDRGDTALRRKETDLTRADGLLTLASGADKSGKESKAATDKQLESM
ncbi:hypothetical protein Neosp_009405 [[Neocosmospora] mangrovei]